MGMGMHEKQRCVSMHEKRGQLLRTCVAVYAVQCKLLLQLLCVEVMQEGEEPVGNVCCAVFHALYDEQACSG